MWSEGWSPPLRPWAGAVQIASDACTLPPGFLLWVSLQRPSSELECPKLRTCLFIKAQPPTLCCMPCVQGLNSGTFTLTVLCGLNRSELPLSKMVFLLVIL